MSMNFISINDFVGEIALDLSGSNVQANFEAIGNNVIYDVLNDLLGASLYNLLIADLTAGQPVTSKYIDLVNGKAYTESSGETFNYQGLKRMLRYFVYESYLEFQHTNNTSLGQVRALTENSHVITRGVLRKVRATIQNKAVSLYNEAIEFLDENNTIYFAGSEYSYWNPKRKKYLGKITTMTMNNTYFYNKSSETI